VLNALVSGQPIISGAGDLTLQLSSGKRRRSKMKTSIGDLMLLSLDAPLSASIASWDTSGIRQATCDRLKRADSSHSLRPNGRAFLRQKAAVRRASLYGSCWTDLRCAHRLGHAEEDRDTLTAAAGRKLFRFEAKAAVDVLPVAAAANTRMACKPTSAKARWDFAVRRRVTDVAKYPTPEILL
jgi:hypothetical protein